MNKALLAVLVAAFLGGALPVFIKIGVGVVPPFSYTLLRFVIAGVVLLPLFLKDLPKVKGSVIKIVILSLLSTANVVFFAFGVKHTTATVGQTLYATVPLFIAVLSLIFLQEKLSAKKIFGLVLGFIGVGFIINIHNVLINQEIRGEAFGNLIILTAVISYCFYQIFSKKLQKDYKPVHLTMFFFLTAIVSQGLLSTTEVSQIPIWLEKLSPFVIGTVLYVGIIGTAVYYYLNQYAIKHGSPVIASLTLYLQPVFTFLWAHFLLGEKLTVNFIVGTIFIFIGVYFVSFYKTKIY